MLIHPTLWPAAAVLALLAACGGGTSSSGSDTPSRASIQSVGANSAVLPNDSTEAAATALTAVRAVAAAGSASTPVGVTVACAGGGTATYSVGGTNNPVQWLNRALDVGETYVISFTDCQSGSTAAPVNGSMTLTVTAAGATLSVDTRTTNLRVTLPLRTVTFNGSSTITQTVSGSGNNATTTTRWTSPAIQVRSQRSSGPSTLFNLSGVNYGRTIGAVNGVPVHTSEGTSSMQADLALFTWFITLATLGPVLYDTTGVLVQGSWLIDLPDDRITLSISNQRVSFQFDLGANGTIDLGFTIDLDTFLADAA